MVVVLPVGVGVVVRTVVVVFTVEVFDTSARTDAIATQKPTTKLARKLCISLNGIAMVYNSVKSRSKTSLCTRFSRFVYCYYSPVSSFTWHSLFWSRDVAVRLKVEIHEIHRLKVEIHMQKKAKSNTGHEIHCKTTKANYRNPPALDRKHVSWMLPVPKLIVGNQTRKFSKADQPSS